MTNIWEKRSELQRLMNQVHKLRSEIRDHEFQQRREKLSHLPFKQREVLRYLVQKDQYYATIYKSICVHLDLTLSQARSAVKALKRLGFVIYMRGLLTDEGQAAGSGHIATLAGIEWWNTVEGPVYDPE